MACLKDLYEKIHNAISEVSKGDCIIMGDFNHGNVRDRVGPLEDNAGNKITQGILMAEELNMHFSSVFTREDASSLPVPETQFEGSEGERLGQLVITQEVIANKINNMKENKSPGVDGIAPKILK